LQELLEKTVKQFGRGVLCLFDRLFLRLFFLQAWFIIGRNELAMSNGGFGSV
jgi:hypothetical protein